MIAAVRWADRLGKGVRTAPRDALIADSIEPSQRGLVFGFHRAADTAGAMIGLVIATIAVWSVQSNNLSLGEPTFRTIVLISLVPAALSVLSLAFGAQDVKVDRESATPKITFKGLGKSFLIFMVIVGLFDLGNSSDAFLILRAQERGISVLGILVMLAVFNLVYSLISTPAGSLSDRIGRKKVIIGGWLVYGLIYLGFAMAQRPWHVWVLYIAYGLYYGLAYGTTKAMVADLVAPELRGTAYGTYNAVLGIIDFPASLIAGVLWQGAGGWAGFGPSAPFLFGSGLAFLAAGLMFFWKPKTLGETS
jgi:MFS family permease